MEFGKFTTLEKIQIYTKVKEFLEYLRKQQDNIKKD